MKLLIIEDNADLAQVLKAGLKQNGYTVSHKSDGLEGLDLLLSDTFQVAIVDMNLPNRTGLEIIKEVRMVELPTGILVLTANADQDLMVEALMAGADDYMTKPFAFEELFARIQALGRRTSSNPVAKEHLKVGGLRFDFELRLIRMDNNAPIKLREKEFQVLALLATRLGRVVTRTVIAERVWGSVLFVSDDAINVTMSGLRKQLEELPECGLILKTLRGIGYVLNYGRYQRPGSLDLLVTLPPDQSLS